MERQSEVREHKYMPVVIVLIGISILVGLYLTSLYSYLLFHGIAEMFSIAVACGIFMIAWVWGIQYLNGIGYYKRTEEDTDGDSVFGDID